MGGLGVWGLWFRSIGFGVLLYRDYIGLTKWQHGIWHIAGAQETGAVFWAADSLLGQVRGPYRNHFFMALIL